MVQAVGIATGIAADSREKIANGLARVLADTYTLYLKTHNFHWNVHGPRFRSLHMLFEEQYTELADAVDDIAERIRTLGYPAPGTYGEFSRLTSISEETGVPEAEEMIRLLVEANETVVRTVRSVLPTAQEAADEATVDLLVGRLSVHEKAVWMLRSSL